MLNSALILAAGESSRVGTAKGLVKMGDLTWLEIQCHSLVKARIRKLVLVLGRHCQHYFDEFPILEMATEGWVPFEGLECLVCLNPDPQKGQFNSLLLGGGNLVATEDAFFVLPIDVPSPSPEVWEALRKSWQPSLRAVIPCHESKGGHPVVISTLFYEAMASRPRAKRLDESIRKLKPSEVIRVETQSPEILSNFNTLHDFKVHFKVKPT